MVPKFPMQAALKTIGEEDKHFSRVSLRFDFTSQFSYQSVDLRFHIQRSLNCLSVSTRMPSFGMAIKSSQIDVPKTDGNSGTAQSSASSDITLDGWDGIALEYFVDWPLQLFFTPEVLSK